MPTLRTCALVSMVLTAVACSSEPAAKLSRHGNGGTDDAPGGNPPPNGQDQKPPAQDDTPVTERFQALADAVEKERVALGAPGVAVAVIEKGQVTFAHGFGSKHPKKNDPAKASTLFRIGSVTKMLTTAAVLHEVGEGKVSLDASIPTVVPEFRFTTDPAAAPSVKLRHLLSHTAGQADLDDSAGNPTIDADDARLRAFFANDWPKQGYLMYPSGRIWDYSNPNFDLAGLLLEKTTGKTYRQAMKDIVFTPLGMSRTIFTQAEVRADGDVAAGRATTFASNGTEEVLEADAYDNAAGRPSGFAYSSVFDMAKFADFLMHGNEAVVKSDLRMQMQSPQVNTLSWGDDEHYGFALFQEHGVFTQDKYYDVQVIEHGGDVPGYSADLHFIPALDLAFVALSNSDGAHFGESWGVVVETIGNVKPSARPKYDVNPATFSKFAGTYTDPNFMGTVTVTASGGTLSVRMEELDAEKINYTPQLDPIAENNFGFTSADLGYPDALTFVLDANGNPEYLRSRGWVAKKGAPGQGFAAQIPKFDRAAYVRALKNARRPSDLWR